MSKKKQGDRPEISRCVFYHVVWRGGTRDLEQEVKDLIAKHCLEGSANEGRHGEYSIGFAWWNIAPGKGARAFRKKLDELMRDAETVALSLSSKASEASYGNLVKILHEAEFKAGLKRWAK